MLYFCFYLLLQRTHEECCDTISISTTLTNIKEENYTKIYKLVKEYPRAYENSAGDRIARYGGVCGMKEKIGYWMVTIQCNLSS